MKGQKKKRKNTFERIAEQNGGEINFEMMRSDKIQRYAISIIKDIAYGNIDYETQGKYFMDEMLIQALKYTLDMKISYYSTINYVTTVYMGTPDKPMINDDMLSRINGMWKQTQDLLFCLNTIRNAVYTTDLNFGDISKLYEVPFILQKFKYVLTFM